MDEFEVIPADQWQAFCGDFSLSHRGWLIRMWVVDTMNLEVGSAGVEGMVVCDMQLREVVAERHGDKIDLVIMLRDQDNHIDHSVRDVGSIMLEREQDGSPVGLRIDSVEGQSTLLQFRVSTPSAALNGLAPGETT